MLDNPGAPKPVKDSEEFEGSKTSDTNFQFRVPETTLRFDNSLGELIELTECHHAHGYIFIIGKRYRLKLAKGRSAQGRVSTKLRTSGLPLTMESLKVLLFQQ